MVYGEDPYAEGHSDLSDLTYSKVKMPTYVKRLQAQGIPVVSVFISGRPLWVNAELNASEAFVAAWLPGSEGGAMAEVLFTDKNGNLQYNFSGKLSFSWPSSPFQTVNISEATISHCFLLDSISRYGDQVELLPTLSEKYTYDSIDREGY